MESDANPSGFVNVQCQHQAEAGIG
ncbi:unnamed protein product [Victoria cruziana]